MIVAGNLQHLFAHRFLAHIQPVEVLLAVRPLLFADQLNAAEARPALFGKLRQPDGFDGVVLTAGVVRFEDVETVLWYTGVGSSV